LVALALATGKTRAEAARAARVSEATVTRRRRDPAFRALVNEIRTRMVDEAIGKLTDALSKSAGRLAALVDSEDEQTALRAARSVLDSAIRLREFADLAGRVEALEKSFAGQLEHPAIPA
jgi:hypothetical protein